MKTVSTSQGTSFRKEECSLHPKACASVDIYDTLRGVELRPTRQRIALGRILFGKGDRHITAETLHKEAVEARVPVSLATVYNTLHQFTDAGLLREIAVNGTKTYFDTNLSDHHHFLVEGENRLLDIHESTIAVTGLTDVPEGMIVDRVDVLVRLRPKTRA
jgi:Fur family iron response transcriptional regulator